MDNNDLPRRWSAALGPQGWAAGMLATDDTTTRYRILRMAGQTPVCWSIADECIGGYDGGDSWPTDCVPDLSDDATKGACLGILRRLFGDNTIHALPQCNHRADNHEPVTVWHIERLREGESEWLRLDGSWGVGNDDSAPPIATIEEFEALILAAEAWRASQPTEPKP